MFTGKMASRYIRCQKRHSILTVCSIVVALALMTMLFMCFSTFTGCMRSVAMDETPYHISVYDLTKEQSDALCKAVGDDGKCDVWQPEQDLYIVNIYFERYIDDRNVYFEDMFRSAQISPDTANYGLNTALMKLDRIDMSSRYDMLQIFCVFYIFVVFIALALRLVIDTAFEVSSKERERQFGVLQSIGATPAQIVRIITCEGLLLSVIGVPIGMAAGIALAYAAFRAVLGSGISEVYFTPEKATELLHFHISPLMLFIAAVTGFVWVLLSAYGTGMRIIRMSPMQAISSRSNTVRKVRRHSLFGLLLGWKGKLAARNNRRQFKRYIITVVSLTISITLFASFSIVIDKVEEFSQEFFIMNQDGTPLTDFEINFSTEPFTPLGYKDDLESIRNTGFFTVIDFDISNLGIYAYDTEERRLISVHYYSEESYARVFGDKPPMSYDKLSAQDGLLLLTDDEKTSAPEKFRGMSSIPVQISKQTNYTKEEYSALPDDRKSLARPYDSYNGYTGGVTMQYYYIRERYIYDYAICGEADTSDIYWTDETYEKHEIEAHDIPVYLAGTLEQYERMAEELYGNNGDGYHYTVYADLANETQYREAARYLEENYPYYLDIYDYHRKQLSVYASVRVGATFINLMIALIAIVNMVNILSTGILNRRNEIAAMQCVGMTRGQLLGMITTECVQYVLGAGVVSLLLSEGLLFATEQFLRATQLIDGMTSFISYSQPLPRILVAALLAFVIALLASLIPLSRMQKTSLVEQLRDMD